MWLQVFSAIDARRAVGIEAEVAMSYVEVYGQEVYDMLRGGIAVGQSRVAGQRYVLDGKCQLVVESLRDVAVLLDQAEAFKRKAVTAMNERSTRAHSLVVLTLCQTEMTTGIKRTSMFSIADLGGSEQLSKSLANEGLKHIGSGTWAEYYEARERLSEATWINTGLFALKRCIDALNDRQAALDSGRALPHVPYQDSKLTQLLSDALGGSSRTTIIVTASLDPQHAVETVQSLRFGERCSTVQNTAGLRGNALQKAIAGLTSGIHALETEIQKKERWEQRRVVRKDIEGTEVMCISVVTGAEEERRKLESLLTQRRKLLGQPEPQQNYPSRPGNSFHHGLDASAMLNP